MKNSIIDLFSGPSRDGPEDEFKDLYKVKKVPYKKDDLYRLQNLFKSCNNYGRIKTSSSYGDGRSHRTKENYALREQDQQVTFKMTYSYSKQAHEKYLNTYMPQKQLDEVKEKPELFGTDKNEYEQNKVSKHFKCIISPERQDIDLELMCNQFIKRLEVLTGYKLDWQASIHENTAHRHAHICINGKDKNGKEVSFPKDYIKRHMRETLSYIATCMKGPRTQAEIEAAQKNMITAKRWTKLDKKILSTDLTIGNIPPDIFSRLSFLEELGLAKKDKKRYELVENWQHVLEANGRYNLFFDEYTKSNGQLELYSGGKIEGKIEKAITFDKDESWNDALIIRTKEGRLVYVPVYQLKKNPEKIINKNVTIDSDSSALSRISDKDVKLHTERQEHKID